MHGPGHDGHYMAMGQGHRQEEPMHGYSTPRSEPNGKSDKNLST